MTQFEEHKSWSMLSPKPVLFGKDMCYWYGIFMHKQMALTIVTHQLLQMPVTPRQKKSLWDMTFEMIHDEVHYHKGVLTFDISEYTPSRLYDYLSKTIYLLTNQYSTLSDWDENPKAILEYFYCNQ